MEYINQILQGDALKMLRKLPTESVHTIVDSPPYWKLRDYGIAGQIGLERTPEIYIKHLVKIFRECKRVLRHDGTLWLNIGDSYAASEKNRTPEQATFKSNLKGSKDAQIAACHQPSKLVGGLKPKDLVGIPWMLAFALRADGWYLRSDIIWSKPNPMPESVTDRPTKSHEYIFLLSKSKQYYYDAAAIRTQLIEHSQNIYPFSDATKKDVLLRQRGKSDKQRGHSRKHAGFNERWDNMSVAEQMANGANKRSVWTVATQPFKDAHFATFPPNLIVDCIKGGTSEYGCCAECGSPYERGKELWQKKCICDTDEIMPAIVLDPFFGAGTTGLVAQKLGRNFIGIELNPAYINIAKKRLQDELGLFNQTLSER